MSSSGHSSCQDHYVPQGTGNGDGLSLTGLGSTLSPARAASQPGSCRLTAVPDGAEALLGLPRLGA